MDSKGNEFFKKQYEVMFSDIDEDYKCRITSIMNFLTDIALGHGEAGGIDFIEENAGGIAQVYLDCKVKINRYPMYRETMELITNVESMQKFYATRKYIAKDSNGEIIFEGTALAVTIDMKKRRLTRIPERYFDIYSVEKKDFAKPDRLQIEDISHIESEKVFEIRHTDRDSNKHVNNMRYIEWALNTINDENLKNYEIAEMNIKFEKEMQKERDVRIQSDLIKTKDGYKSIYKFFNEDEEQVNAMEFIWRRKLK